MQIFDNVRGALRALRANKLRSILTMLGIVIGVSAVISLLSIGQGVEKFINDQFNALGTNLLFVAPKLGNSQQSQMIAQMTNQTTLTQGDARALGDSRQLPDVASSTAMIRLNALARFRDAKLTTTIQGANAEYLTMRGLEVAEGRGLTDDDVQGVARVAVIGQTVLDELFPSDTNPLDQFIRLNDVPFRVIGVLPEKGGNQFANEDNQIIVPLTAVRMYLRDIRAGNGLPGVSTILMQGVDPDTNAVLKDDAANVLRDRHNISYRNEDDFRVFTQADLLAIVRRDQRGDYGVPLGDCGHLAAGGRHRRDEHHAGDRHRTHARDRLAQSDRGQAARYSAAVPDRVDDALAAGRRDRHCDRRGRRGGGR